MNEQFIDYLEKCNFFRKIVDHSGNLNMLYNYYSGKSGERCEVLYDEPKKKHIRTRCRNTTDLITFLLFKKHLENNDFSLIDSPIVAMDALRKYNMISLSIYGSTTITHKQSFPGHIFIIVKLAKNLYAIYQSYVGNYETRVIIADEKTVNYYIHNYFIALSIRMMKHWTKTNTDIWRRITYVDEKKFEGDILHNDIHLFHPSNPLQLQNNRKICDDTIEDFLKNVEKKLNYDINNNLIDEQDMDLYVEQIEDIRSKNKDIEFYILDDLGFIDFTIGNIVIQNVKEPYFYITEEMSKISIKSPKRDPVFDEFLKFLLANVGEGINLDVGIFKKFENKVKLDYGKVEYLFQKLLDIELFHISFIRLNLLGLLEHFSPYAIDYLDGFLQDAPTNFQIEAVKEWFYKNPPKTSPPKKSPKSSKKSKGKTSQFDKFVEDIIQNINKNIKTSAKVGMPYPLAETDFEEYRGGFKLDYGKTKILFDELLNKKIFDIALIKLRLVKILNMFDFKVDYITEFLIENDIVVDSQLENVENWHYLEV